MSLEVNRTTAADATKPANSAQNADKTQNAQKNQEIKEAKAKYSEEELQLLDFDGDGEISEEEIKSTIALHDKEMEKISNEYDSRHPEETSYAWANKGAWSKDKQEYMNAQSVLYKEAHPEYKLANNLSAPKVNEITTSIDKKVTNSTKDDADENESSKTTSRADGKDSDSLLKKIKDQAHNNNKKN